MESRNIFNPLNQASDEWGGPVILAQRLGNGGGLKRSPAIFIGVNEHSFSIDQVSVYRNYGNNLFERTTQYVSDNSNYQFSQKKSQVDQLKNYLFLNAPTEGNRKDWVSKATELLLIEYSVSLTHNTLDVLKAIFNYYKNKSPHFEKAFLVQLEQDVHKKAVQLLLAQNRVDYLKALIGSLNVDLEVLFEKIINHPHLQNHARIFVTEVCESKTFEGPQAKVFYEDAMVDMLGCGNMDRARSFFDKLKVAPENLIKRWLDTESSHLVKLFLSEVSYLSTQALDELSGSLRLKLEEAIDTGYYREANDYFCILGIDSWDLLDSWFEASNASRMARFICHVMDDPSYKNTYLGVYAAQFAKKQDMTRANILIDCVTSGKEFVIGECSKALHLGNAYDSDDDVDFNPKSIDWRKHSVMKLPVALKKY